jgi:hypothetical protein
MKSTLFMLALAASMLATQAQNQPSSKVTAKTSALTLIPKGNGNGQWVTCLENKIKTANMKDLAITASMEVGLFTQTKVSSKNMVEDTAVGQAEVEVRVMVDGHPVEPGVVVFGRRTQTLTATLEGAIGSCLVSTNNADGTISTTVDLACVTPENISLILDSLTASAFTFIATDVPQGVHTISVQARTATIGSAQMGTYSALAFVGKGSMVAESIRLRKGDEVIDVP